LRFHFRFIRGGIHVGRLAIEARASALVGTPHFSKNGPRFLPTAFENRTSHWSRLPSSDPRSLCRWQLSVLGKDLLEWLPAEPFIKLDIHHQCQKRVVFPFLKRCAPRDEFLNAFGPLVTIADRFVAAVDSWRFAV
jgi:hypothetical protein